MPKLLRRRPRRSSRGRRAEDHSWVVLGLNDPAVVAKTGSPEKYYAHHGGVQAYCSGDWTKGEARIWRFVTKAARERALPGVAGVAVAVLSESVEYIATHATPGNEGALALVRQQAERRFPSLVGSAPENQHELLRPITSDEVHIGGVGQIVGYRRKDGESYRYVYMDDSGAISGLRVTSAGEVEDVYTLPAHRALGSNYIGALAKFASEEYVSRTRKQRQRRQRERERQGEKPSLLSWPLASKIHVTIPIPAGHANESWIYSTYAQGLEMAHLLRRIQAVVYEKSTDSLRPARNYEVREAIWTVLKRYDTKELAQTHKKARHVRRKRHRAQLVRLCRTCGSVTAGDDVVCGACGAVGQTKGASRSEKAL